MKTNRALVPCSFLVLTLTACSSTTEVAGGEAPDTGADATTPPGCWSTRLQGSTQAIGQPAPRPEAVAVAADGSIVVAGSFWHVLRVGDAEPIRSAYKNVFVLKLRSDGTTDWVRTFSTSESMDSTRVDADVAPDGRILLTGSFCGDIDLGSIVLTQPGPSPECLDGSAFIATLERGGGTAWGRAFGSGLQACASIAAGPEAVNIAVGLGLQGVDFGIDVPGFGYGSYAAGLNATGAAEWVTFEELDAYCRAASASTGWFVGGGGQETPEQPAAALLVAIDQAGHTRWRKLYGGIDPDSSARVSGVATLLGGGAAISGVFRGHLDMGVGDPFANNPVQRSDWGFVAAVDDNGTTQWARLINNGGAGSPDLPHNVGVSDIAILPSGDLLVGGRFSGGSAKFDVVWENGAPLGDTVQQISDPDSTDAFLASYGADGSFRFVRTFGLPHSSQTISTLASGPSGEVVAAGNYGGGPLDLGCGPLPEDGGAFVVRYEPGSLTAQ